MSFDLFGGGTPTAHTEQQYHSDVAASINNDQQAALALARALMSRKLGMATATSDFAAARIAVNAMKTLGSDDRTHAAQKAFNDALVNARVAKPSDVYPRALVTAWKWVLARAQAATQATVGPSQSQQFLSSLSQTASSATQPLTQVGGSMEEGAFDCFGCDEIGVSKGAYWDNSIDYERGDIVWYNGKFWRAQRHIDHPWFPILSKGEEPGNSDAWVDAGNVSIGFEYMDLAKAGAGLMSGFGGMFSGGGGGGGGAAQQTAAQAAAEKQRLEDEKRRAEQSAMTMKIALGVVGGVAVLGGAALLLRK